MRRPKQMMRDWLGVRDDAQIVPSGPYNTMQLLDALPPRTRIDKYGALFSSDYLACETAKARALRSLPVHVMRKGDHGPEKVPGHPLSAVLHRPNALMAWGDLVAWAVLRRDTLGTAYIRVLRDSRGGIRELRPVLAPVTVRFDRETGVAVWSAPQDSANDAWECREDDIVILKTDVSDDGGIRGRSIAEMAADDIGLSVDLVRFYRSLLENGNHFQGYLETDQRLTKEDREAIRESLDETRGPESAGAIRMFDRGVKYHEVSAKLEGMDLIAQEKWVLQKVCRACHVDMHHVFADEGAAATTATGADIDFVKNTVLPEVTAFEQAFQPVLDRAASLGGGKDSGYYVKFNLNGLMRGDFTKRMEGYRIGVYAGMFTRQYVAEQEDIPWLEGQDKLLQPTAYYMVDEDGVPYIPAAGTNNAQRGQSDGQSGIEERAVSDALRPIVDDAKVRIAKRAERDGDTPKTRDFARTVLEPIAFAAAQMGDYIDIEEVIDAILEAD